MAYTRPKNIRDLLIRAKLPSKTRQRRKIPGMKKCKENCSICPYVNSCKSVKSTYTDNIVPLNKEFDCLTQNLVYLVHCKKCNDQYVGETKNTLRKRFSQHLGYVDSKDFRQATGRHFHLPGHQKSHMSITVLEKLYTDDTAYRKRRESHILNFSTLSIEE